MSPIKRNRQKDIMKDIVKYQHYVLDKLIESTEVIYSPKLDYSDSWFYIHYPYDLKNSVYIGESFDHPFSFVKFEAYVQDNYGILDDEVSSLWASYRKYVADLSRKVSSSGANDVDLVT